MINNVAFIYLLVNVCAFLLIRYEKKAVLNNLPVTKYHHKEFIKFEKSDSSWYKCKKD